MNFKQAGAALIILILLGVGFGYWASKTPGGALGVQEEHLLAGVATSTGGYEYTETGDVYTIAVHYPSTRAQIVAYNKASAAIETSLKAEIDDFKQSVQGLDATMLPSLADGHKLELIVDYKAYSGTLPSTGSVVSYDFTIFADTGGAHPNTYFKTFVFDQSGRLLTIKDILASNPNGLEELSLLVSNDVTAQMKQRLQESDVTSAIFPEGLAPKEENFQDFMIDGDTLVIEIPPYQVAAYVMGSFEVRIKLKDIQ